MLDKLTFDYQSVKTSLQLRISIYLFFFVIYIFDTQRRSDDKADHKLSNIPAVCRTMGTYSSERPHVCIYIPTYALPN